MVGSVVADIYYPGMTDLALQQISWKPFHPMSNELVAEQACQTRVELLAQLPAVAMKLVANIVAPVIATKWAVLEPDVPQLVEVIEIPVLGSNLKHLKPNSIKTFPSYSIKSHIFSYHSIQHPDTSSFITLFVSINYKTISRSIPYRC